MVILKSKSGRFILRLYRKGDEKSLYENINNIKVTRYIANIPHPYSLKDAKEWVEKCIEENKKRKKHKLILVIDINGEVAGCVNLTSIVHGHKAELGYWLAEKYWNEGIVSEAAKLIVDYGFKKFNLKRIHATAIPVNKGSWRVMEKIGFNYEGTLKKAVKKDGKFYDLVLYAKVK